MTEQVNHTVTDTGVRVENGCHTRLCSDTSTFSAAMTESSDSAEFMEVHQNCPQDTPMGNQQELFSTPTTEPELITVGDTVGAIEESVDASEDDVPGRNLEDQHLVHGVVLGDGECDHAMSYDKPDDLSCGKREEVAEIDSHKKINGNIQNGECQRVDLARSNDLCTHVVSSDSCTMNVYRDCITSRVREAFTDHDHDGSSDDSAGDECACGTAPNAPYDLSGTGDEVQINQEQCGVIDVGCDNCGSDPVTNKSDLLVSNFEHLTLDNASDTNSDTRMPKNCSNVLDECDIIASDSKDICDNLNTSTDNTSMDREIADRPEPLITVDSYDVSDGDEQLIQSVLEQSDHPDMLLLLDNPPPPDNPSDNLLTPDDVMFSSTHTDISDSLSDQMCDCVSAPLNDSDDNNDDDSEFFDAVDTEEYKVCLPKGHRRGGSGVSLDSIGAQLRSPNTDNYDSSDSDFEKVDEAQVICSKSAKTKRHRTSSQDSRRSATSEVTEGRRVNAPNAPLAYRKRSGMPARKRRTTIPEKPSYSLNLWGIMKNCIGKELSKIPMPVNFSEPLSFLQRLAEDFEYSHCLDEAARCTDSCEQLAYVAAFTISSYSTTTNRSSKPFNPLLGETYEYDRTEDYGWRIIAEQVSHHPPTVAMHAESENDWKSWQEFTMSSKFRGKYLQIIPLGIAHLVFPKDNNHYTWRKVATTVHNIIVGRLWVDNHGEMDITNHNNGDTCHLKYSAYSYFSREVPRKVTGVITDSSGAARWVIQGTWSDKIEGAKVLNTIESKNGKKVYETGPQKVLWQRQYPQGEVEKIYNFTDYAVQLNEPEEGVAPTDSRLRPDQRYMEIGAWDEANTTKLQLEEKQRAARRKREAEAAEAANQGKKYPAYEPLWFRNETDPQTGGVCHVFTEEYWKCKASKEWDRCPDIYLSPEQLPPVPLTSGGTV